MDLAAWRAAQEEEFEGLNIAETDFELTQTVRARHLGVRLFRWASSPWSAPLRSWNRLVAHLWLAWSTYTMGSFYPFGKMSEQLLATLRLQQRRSALPSALLQGR